MRTAVLTEDQATKGLDYQIEVKIFEEGAQLVPSSALITVKNPDGTEQVSDVAMTIDDDGTLTYTLIATYTATLWENALIEIQYVVSSITQRLTFLFDVVNQKLVCSADDDDLKKYYPALDGERWADSLGFHEQIGEAFNLVRRDIKNKGRRPAMILDGMQVRELTILKTLEIIFFGFSKSTEDIWWARYQEIQKKYEALLGGLVIRYDEDEDAIIDSDEKGTTIGQINMQR